MRSRDLPPSVVLVAAALACPATACTAFDGVVPPAGGAGGTTSTGGAGGGTGEAEHYLSPEKAAAVCALVRECDRLGESIELSFGIPARAGSFSSCMTWLAGPLPAERTGFSTQQKVLEAIAAARSCDAALAHTFFQPLPDPGACGVCVTLDGKSYADDCDNGVRINCASALFDEGSTCRQGKNGEVRCSTGECCATAGGLAECVTFMDAVDCAGERLTFCPDKDPKKDETGGLSGLAQGLDCAAIGIPCVDVDIASLPGEIERLIPCAPPSDECAGQTKLTCADAGTVRACPGGVASLTDCTSIGRTCQAGADAVPLCLPAGAACAPGEDGASSCKDGVTLAYCLAGAAAELDCASIGRVCAGEGGGLSAGCQLP